MSIRKGERRVWLALVLLLLAAPLGTAYTLVTITILFVTIVTAI